MNAQELLPPLFIEKLKSTFPSSVVDSILQGYEYKRPPTIRVNTLKSSLETVMNELKNQKIQIQSVPWMKEALIVINTDTRALTELELYKNGAFYIQSLSSMIPALVLNPQENELVLDMAAAPGSKTIQIAAMMKNTGKITANDPNRDRLFKLKQNLERQGVINTDTFSKDGQSIWQLFPEYFDKVLIDVPCSMEGTFECANPNTYKYWSTKISKRLSKMQKWLLRSAVSCTKPGGTIVYSTCTVSPDENEGVIDWILEKERDSIKLEEVVIPAIETHPSFVEYKNKNYSPQLKKTLRILPSLTMEGFFVAKIKKVKSNM